MHLSAHYIFPILKCLFVILFFIHLFGDYSQAAGNLRDLSDVVASIVGDVPNVGHEIKMTLPLDSDEILPSDYVNIEMAYYDNIQIDGFLLSGAYSGTPIATVSGQVVKITGISVFPGNSIIAKGIVADNPASESWMYLVISVSEDEAGDIVKNVGTVYASKTSGQITVSATIAPPYASVRLSGYAGPGTFITITENGTVIGTDTAGIAGVFNKYLTGITPGTHTFSLYGVDQSDRTTSLLDVTAITPIYQETLISNLLLSPTIEINTASIDQGDDLISWGSALINGNLSIFTEPHLRTYYATASALGNWSYTIDNTDEYIPGDYHIYALVQNGTGNQSNFSNALQFRVNSLSGGTDPTCDISRGDLNCDDSINLYDFSIMMYYWGSINAVSVPFAKHLIYCSL